VLTARGKPWPSTVVLLSIAACGFHQGTFSQPSDASVDRVPMDGSSCGGQVWVTDFMSDPVGSAFQMRNGEPLPGTLGSGVWTENGTLDSTPLDTQPDEDFTTETYIHVRMRNTTVPPPSPDMHGAVCWINFGYTTTQFTPLFIDAMLQSNGTQLVQVFDKIGSAEAENSLYQITLDDDDMHDYYLDISPTLAQATLTIDDTTTTVISYTTIARGNNNDQFVSLDTWSDTVSEFGYFLVESCPPP
jgi:hypothetical protein